MRETVEFPAYELVGCDVEKNVARVCLDTDFGGPTEFPIRCRTEEEAESLKSLLSPFSGKTWVTLSTVLKVLEASDTPETYHLKGKASSYVWNRNRHVFIPVAVEIGVPSCPGLCEKV